MARSVRSLVLLATLIAALWALVAIPAAGAQSGPSTSLVPTSIDAGSGAGALGQILPEPNSGRAPQVDGDRGSRSQLILLAVLAGGLTLIGSLAARDMRKARSARAGRTASGDQPGATSTRNEPVADTSVNPPSSSARQ